MVKYVSDESSWERYFGENGILSQKIILELQQVGASPDKVDFHCYLSNQKVILSDYSCLILPGGDAELGCARLIASSLDKQLADYQGTIIAYSAGALLLLDQYFLSPNYYYTSFSIHSGLGILCKEIALEVHYDGSKDMNRYIWQGVETLCRSVYAIGNDGAISLNDDFNAIIIGDVKRFDP